MKGFVLLALLCGLLCAPVVLAGADSGGGKVPGPAPDGAPGPELQDASDLPSARPGLGRRILWYVPNRVLDLLDVCRLRLRLGPGLAVNVRMTDYGAFYIGRYNSVFMGLPGPRYPQRFRWPAGFESLDGIVLMGVDATDDTPRGPRYSATEVNAGAQLLLVGAEAGVDPIELWDLLAGVILLDPRDDDFPRAPRPAPSRTSALSIGPGVGALQVEEKPETFDRWSDRLDYLHVNVQKRIDNPLREGDQWFTEEGEKALDMPETRIRMGLYTEIVEDGGIQVSLEPDIRFEVEMPNLKHRIELFIETAKGDDLPGRRRSEQEDRGLTVGASRWMDNLKISADAGIRAKWLPELFARLTWKPTWRSGKWGFLPQQRLFWEGEEGFGTVGQFGIYRWLGGDDSHFIRSQSAARWTESTEGVEWQQTFGVGRITSLIDEVDRGGNIGFEDLSNGYGLAYSVFGDRYGVTEHRLVFGVRWPLYRRWLFADLQPGLEWREKDDYETAFRLTVGIDMLFWGAGYR